MGLTNTVLRSEGIFLPLSPQPWLLVLNSGAVKIPPLNLLFPNVLGVFDGGDNGEWNITQSHAGV